MFSSMANVTVGHALPVHPAPYSVCRLESTSLNPALGVILGGGVDCPRPMSVCV